MTHTGSARRLVALGAAIVATAGVGAYGAAPAAARPAPARAVETTLVTFAVPSCGRCVVGVYQIAADGQSGWGTAPKQVKDKRVTFKVPSDRTHGLVATISAPWDGDLGYTTMVVLRYAGHERGDDVTRGQARGAQRGSACFAGTNADKVRIPLAVEKVTVDGTEGKTDGTLAYARVTQRWWLPMHKTTNGVYAAHSSVVCHQD